MGTSQIILNRLSVCNCVCMPMRSPPAAQPIVQRDLPGDVGGRIQNQASSNATGSLRCRPSSFWRKLCSGAALCGSFSVQLQSPREGIAIVWLRPSGCAHTTDSVYYILNHGGNDALPHILRYVDVSAGWQTCLYVQELCEKVDQLPQDIEWHFIGHLQSNKVKALLQSCPNLAMLETVDSQKLANKVDAAVEAAGREPLPILIQVFLHKVSFTTNKRQIGTCTPSP
jgi:hypothetical protein